MTMLQLNDVEKFLQRNGNGYVMAREDDYEELMAKKKFATRVVVTVPYLLRQKNLVVFTTVLAQSEDKNSAIPSERILLLPNFHLTQGLGTSTFNCEFGQLVPTGQSQCSRE
jgi:hypothetical protein